MITPEVLLNIAIEAALDQVADPANRHAARQHQEKAIAAAVWLENQPVKEVIYLGCFGDVLLEKGQTVRVKKGATIHSCHPLKGQYRAARSYKIEIHRIGYGEVYVDSSLKRGGGFQFENPIVWWAGTGGYWCWTDAANVESL